MLLVRDELRHAVTSGKHAVTIGVFDGVHRGHAMLIEHARNEAKTRGLGTGVVTFHPNPLAVLRPGSPFAYLTTLEQRVELLKATGVDWVAVVQFTSELSLVSAEDFARLLVEEAGMRLLVVGEDFALGRGREGDVPRLRELGTQLGFEVSPVPLLTNDSTGAISSTRVRRALAEGEMAEVTRLLGRPYSLRGPVLHGDERGHTIGFPTLNIGVSADQALPPNGVYVTRAEVQGVNVQRHNQHWRSAHLRRLDPPRRDLPARFLRRRVRRGRPHRAAQSPARRAQIRRRRSARRADPTGRGRYQGLLRMTATPATRGRWPPSTNR